VKNPKPEIQMTKQIQSTSEQTRCNRSRNVSGFEVRDSFVIRHSSLVIVSLLLALNLQLSTAWADAYSIDWFTLDGGGGTSTGGVYSVSGTIGQPDAGGPLSGGQYSLTGGFWSLLSVVQTPGSPLLSIKLTATNTALVSWPSPSTGFSLQQNTNGVGTVNWSNVLTAPTDNGTIKYIIVNPPTGSRFYRLIQP